MQPRCCPLSIEDNFLSYLNRRHVWKLRVNMAHSKQKCFSLTYCLSYKLNSCQVKLKKVFICNQCRPISDLAFLSWSEMSLPQAQTDPKYSDIPLLWPPKIKTSYPLNTLFVKLKLFFSSFSTHSVPLIRDHLWDCPKVVFKTTFGQSQRWS